MKYQFSEKEMETLIKALEMFYAQRGDTIQLRSELFKRARITGDYSRWSLWFMLEDFKDLLAEFRKGGEV